MKNRIQELDALRGLAALFVLAFHFTLNNPLFHDLLNPGATGIDLFFMISGFVIILIMENSRSLKQFAISRFTRLFPAYWACVTVTFIVFTFATIGFAYLGEKEWMRYLGNLTMVPQYFRVRLLDGSYWTMLVELLFYVFMAIVFATRSLKRINIIGYYFLAFCLFYTLLLKTHRVEYYEIIRSGFPLINYFPLFFAGILFYKIRTGGRQLYLLPGIAACFIVQLMLFDEGLITRLFVSFWQYAFWIGLYFFIFWLVVRGHMKFIAIRPLLFLGTISYSMYLLHQTISRTYLIPMFYDRFHHSLALSFAFSFAVIFILSVLITFCIEKPSTTWLKKKLYKLFKV